MKVLIIGGSKFIGRSIANHAARHGHQLTLFNRGKSEPDGKFPLIKGDLDKFTDFKQEIRQLNPDIVVHCLCNTEKNAEDCLKVFEGSKTKILVLSSQDCYEDFQELVRGREVSELPIAESSPLCRIRYYLRDILPPGKKGEFYDKNLMTNVLIQAHKEKKIKVSIFRLPMVYGPYDYQYPFRHGAIIRRIYDQQNNFVLSANEQNKLWPFAYVENIAAAIVHAFDQKITEGKIYNLGENKYRSWRRWCELFAAAANWQFNYYILPDELITENKELLNQAPKHIIADNTAFIRDTGFQPPNSLNEAIKKTLDYGLNNPDILGEQPDYAKEQELVNKYQKFLKSI